MVERMLHRIKCLHGDSRRQFYESLLFMLTAEMDLANPMNGNRGDRWGNRTRKRISVLVKLRGQVLAHYLFGPGCVIANRRRVLPTNTDVEFFGALHQEASEHKIIQKQVWNIIGTALDAAGRRCN